MNQFVNNKIGRYVNHLHQVTGFYTYLGVRLLQTNHVFYALYV